MTTPTDKLTIEDVQEILDRKENLPITWQLGGQLADTMRENERFHLALKHLKAETLMVLGGNCSRSFDRTMDEVNALLHQRKE